jgi:hypothetical protein
LVKAFPQPSQKHEETVCCAGIAEDTGELLRLYPIRYRRLNKENQFDRFDLIEMKVTRATDDYRPESYRVDHDSIRLLESGRKLSEKTRVELWKPHLAPSLKALLEQNKQTYRSLGIIKPDPGSLQFKIKPAANSETEDQEIADLVFKQQLSFLEDPLKPLDRPSYSFHYEYTCNGHPHKHQIHDWEVQAALNNYKRRYKTEQETLDKMMQAYQVEIPSRNLHFIMGTMKARPQTFIVIGLLRTGLDPEELDKQGKLF